MEALQSLPPGSQILDLPCGSGRLTRLLIEQGFRVTAADVSEPMLNIARSNIPVRRSPKEKAFSEVAFDRRDVMQTGYADKQFDAVICNRLFHHFTESDTRLRALQELRRISRGSVIISFFNVFALDAAYRRMRDILLRRTPRDRIPISYKVFNAELRAAGLRVQKRIAVRWGISPHWYVVAV